MNRIRPTGCAKSRAHSHEDATQEIIHSNERADGMPALKAYVQNGRLKLDEPTDLPEGTVVPLEVADDWDDLDDEERAGLHESISEGIEDMEARRTIDAKTTIAELRSRL
jgi:hypothetical protein